MRVVYASQKGQTVIILDRQSAGEYWPLILAGAVLFVPSLVLFPFTNALPPLQMCRTTLLCASGVSPWGVVTSIFIYDSWANFILFAMLVIIFALTHFLVSKQERWRRQKFVIISMFLVAIGLNVVWVLLARRIASLGPAEACGIKVESRNKWITLIRNASNRKS